MDWEPIKRTKDISATISVREMERRDEMQRQSLRNVMGRQFLMAVSGELDLANELYRKLCDPFSAYAVLQITSLGSR